MTDANESAQKEICEKYGAAYYPSPSGMKVGIALNGRNGTTPINGLRHPPEGDTTGWFIWAGDELSDDPDFFKPLHVQHLRAWCPQVQKYLALPPGWRFLVAGDYEDVWYDESLLNI
ncbi:immunity protein Imm33 domain-containing protein [Sinorhizobium glycinis]|uniref:immunity protein Imm33 domain-containing protein n=1 Tax=Sinorhizobium glycinis TaxID=1472378 RepID=UPI001FCE2A68|nr:hypothetical protein [Sinorhizobium glycinis]